MIHYFALVGFCIHKGKNVDVEGMHIKAIALYLACYVPGVTLKKLCDALNITLSEFFDCPEFNDMDEEIE